MKLYTREWGSGDRTVLLVHGLQSGSRGWWQVGPALAALGYRVVAVDLPGHGKSPRSDLPTPELFAASLLESAPARVDVAIGHSLGAAVLALGVARLRLGRAVYVDPPFGPPGPDLDRRVVEAVFIEKKNQTRESLLRSRPYWSTGAIDIELQTLRDWDVATSLDLVTRFRGERIMPELPVPSLVIRADPSDLVTDELAAELLARGVQVRTVPGSPHTIHFGNFEGFMAALAGWV